MTGPNRTRAFLGLGGNLGDPARSMAIALQTLDRHADLDVARVSSLYRAPPWGKTDQPDFLNAVAEIETRLQPRELLDLCLDTERALKRERYERWGPRLIDIDVLMFGDRRISQDALEIPHPRMLQRAFVLVPLAEIAPGLMLEGRSIGDHLETLDAAGIERISDDRSWWMEPV
ncbi:2-amino-4-hydroxy-6-hydroxymethyldihydropteridine diphosphokinase [Chelativorans sp. AA-79]|uniref:2-amino-4-hydroxy-6- hydroxymethyldihydropteridine diphosphokinase n=1 Tax=Chelativorans sp. AA-79 TaxID=3028735 RepID=UPI0023F832B0|nr:2-amino-4-hydroxy-6-hydroxymethyldihydropteridine diphosphokinase [Chelativorans sp. AA-79]WEX07422.1 2-amino-4-hydroxy-6-hydroxymethyldihydropteridine diphosphokinase [Chelativorans sp. AA-79]